MRETLTASRASRPAPKPLSLALVGGGAKVRATDEAHRLGEYAPPRRSSWVVSYRRRALLADILVALATGAVCALTVGAHEPLLWRLALVVGIPLLWVATLAMTRGYERHRLGAHSAEYRAVMYAACVLVGAVALLSYLTNVAVPKSISLVAALLLLGLGLPGRGVLRRSLYRRRAAGRDTQATVVIGNVTSVVPMVREIRRAQNQGLRVVAACVSGLEPNEDGQSEVEGVPVFGYPEEAMSAIDLFDAEVVAVSSDPDLHGPELRRLAWSLEDRDIDLVVSSGLLGVAGSRLSIRPTAGMPLLDVAPPAWTGRRRVVKAVIDRTLVLVLAVVAVPIMLCVAAAIRLDSPGPVFFRQRRVGVDGVAFDMVKFRTMCVDAEARLAQLQRDAGNDVLFKMKNDPRVTRVGRVLRRFSLDELPQLINVVRGEMSLVGPRPPLEREVAAYEPDALRRLRVRPGLTGLWQVSGRSNLDWEESLRLDLWYVDNWTPGMDLKILSRTARAVLLGTGAY